MLIRGMDLRPEDGSSVDPYCLINFDSHDEQIEKKSQVKKGTQNPNWNEMFEFTIKFAKEGPVPPIHIILKDWDKISGDDNIGECSVDITNAIEKPCEWSIDDNFDIIDPEDHRKDAKP